MPITRKPTDEPMPQGVDPESPAFQEYLRKGGSAAGAQPDQPDHPKDIRFTLQIPGVLCQQLDQLREHRPLKTSRHQWVLEAILEKVHREQASGS